MAITGSIFILLGVLLLGGGAYLVSLGGSPYYLVAGIGLIATGALVWKAHLPAGGQATPMSYVSDKTGKQYVMAGGHGSLGTRMGDELVAFALPDGVASSVAQPANAQ